MAVTIVTTCMQRLDFLKQALPTWLEHTSFPILVVDYSCPEGTGAWIRRHGNFGGRVSIVSCEASKIGGRPVFSPSRARNAGANAEREGWLLFLDADTQLKKGFGLWVENALRPGVMLAVVGRPSPLFGALCVHSGALRAAGGYDEGFTGWGGEDLDLRIRLHLAGHTCVPMPEPLMRSIPHSNALRARNSVEPDFVRARRLNGDYLDEKLIRTTGRPLKSWVADQGVDCLCSKGADPMASASPLPSPPPTAAAPALE